MPRKRNKSAGRNHATGRKTKADPGALGFIDTCYVGAKADTNFSTQDVVARPPNHLLRESPPRVLRNQYFWIKQGQASVYSPPQMPLVGQFSKIFYLSDVFDSANFQKIFDQYCLYGIVISFTQSTVANVSSVGTVTSVIDFTDVVSLGSSSEAKSYSTSETSVLLPGKPHMRFFKPCTSQQLYRPSLAAYGPERAWVDILYPDAPHYGIKALFYDFVGAAQVEVQVDYLLGFRSTK